MKKILASVSMLCATVAATTTQAYATEVEAQMDNMIVNEPNVIIKDQVIAGDLVIGEGVMNGEITLENVTVTGKIVAHSGNRDVINFKNSYVEGGLEVAKKAYVMSTAAITPDIARISLGAEMKIKGAQDTTLAITITPLENFEIAETVVFKNNDNETVVGVELVGLTSFMTGESIFTGTTFAVANEKWFVAGTYDGLVLAYDFRNDAKWRVKVDDAAVTQIVAEDVDGDGTDELFVASMDGMLTAIAADGTKLWEYKTEAPLYTVAVARTVDGTPYVFCGGADQLIHKLSAEGEMIQTTQMQTSQGKTSVLIRNLKTVQLTEGGPETVVGIGTSHVGAVDVLKHYDPADISEPLWETSMSALKAKGTYMSIFDAIDLDGDGTKEIVLPKGANGECGDITAVNADGTLYKSLVETDTRVIHRGYRMGTLTNVDAAEPYILNQFGNQVTTLNYDLELQEVYTAMDSFNTAFVDNETSKLYLIGTHSGGDTVEIIDLKSKANLALVEAIEETGRLQEVIDNLIELNKQVEEFVMPKYQTKTNSDVVAEVPEDDTVTYEVLLSPNGVIDFVSSMEIPGVPWNYYEDFDRDAVLDEFWAAKSDKRRTSPVSAEQIISTAKSYEERDIDFSIWAGHGNDPFYISVSTLIEVIKAAPTTCKMLIYPELGHNSPEIKYLVDNLFNALGKVIIETGAQTKIFFRNKGMFWSADANAEPWRSAFTSEYAAPFVPGMEESNGRMQETSSAARVGMWLSTDLETWGSRQVEDNTSYSRVFQNGMQMIQSHYIRAMVHEASNGAKSFQNGGGTAYDQLAVVYKMIDNGSLLIPSKDDLASLSGLALAWKSEVDPEFQSRSTNINYIADFKATGEHDPSAFDRLDQYWGGAKIEEYDFSSYANGVTHRRVNFLPENPYGMVAHIAEDIAIEGSRFADRVITDGKYFYDEDGKQYNAVEYKDVVVEKLEEQAKKLPIRVENSNWTVVAVDETHYRVTLIDSDYLSPRESVAMVILQNMEGVAATNILSGEVYPIVDGKFEVTVPAGIFAIVDIEIR
ncbi:hypothetical protein [Candidatus Epulonipiscium viviparus]|uniref:hypothetical protein n=1 Tax=Candidatus Epulonipiscium viviparus TaxID=420336 RepID=UPI0027381391|nr:hypothetical protein [Candidatus Epulopiscium viviparus]